MTISRRISATLALAMLCWAAWYLWSKRGELAPYLHLDLLDLTGVFVAGLLYILFQGALLRTILLPQGVRLRAVEWFGCIAVTLMWNYVLPFAGVGYRALYLKRVHGLEYRDFLASTSAIYILEILVFGLGGLAGIAFRYASGNAIPMELAITFGAIVFGCMALLLFSPKPPEMPGRAYAKLKTVIEAWYRTKQSPLLVAKCAGWTLLVFLAYCAMYYFAFSAMAKSVLFTETFIVAALSDFALFIRLTPAAIGPFEASVAYSVRLYGLDLAQGLFAAGLIRAATIVLFLLLGPLFQYLLSDRSRGSDPHNPLHA